MVADAELAGVLARALRAPVRICARARSPYASSFPLERLDVETGAGERLALVWKELTPGALLPAGRRARGGAAPDPARELRAYELLDRAQLGTARRYQALEEPSRAWLFLEAVDGTRLDEIGEREAWQAVARWLARAHGALAGLADGAPWPPPWRAPSLAAALARTGGERWRRIAALGDPLAVAVGRVARLPAGVLHGELYPANVLVARERVCALDWETIARGPALLDLAALTAGKWAEPGEPLAEAYRLALPEPPPSRALRADLDACRLLVAVGWLAAPADWAPPSAQARDWLADAELVARRLLA